MNSTKQENKEFSQKLYEVTPNFNLRKENISTKGLGNWQTNNEYRTSYNDMSKKV